MVYHKSTKFRTTKFPSLQLNILSTLAETKYSTQQEVLRKLNNRKEPVRKDSISRAFIELSKDGKKLIHPYEIKHYQKVIKNEKKHEKKGRGTRWEINDDGIQALVQNVEYLEPFFRWKLIFNAFDTSNPKRINKYKYDIFPNWEESNSQPNRKYFSLIFEQQLDSCKKYTNGEHRTSTKQKDQPDIFFILEKIAENVSILQGKLIEILPKVNKIDPSDNHSHYWTEILEMLSHGLIYRKPPSTKRYSDNIEDNCELSLTQFGILVLINRKLNEMISENLMKALQEGDRFNAIKDKTSLIRYFNKIMKNHTKLFPQIHSILAQVREMDNIPIKILDKLTMWYFEGVSLYEIVGNDRLMWKILSSESSLFFFHIPQIKKQKVQMENALIQWVIENGYFSQDRDILNGLLLNAERRYILETNNEYLSEHYKKGEGNEIRNDKEFSEVVEKLINYSEKLKKPVNPVYEIVKLEDLEDPYSFEYKLDGAIPVRYDLSILESIKNVLSFHFLSIMKTNYPNEHDSSKRFMDILWYDEWYEKCRKEVIEFEKNNLKLLEEGKL